MQYDYLIVGAGLFGATFAYEAGKKGKKCLVIDKRPHVGGNIYTYENEGINVHKYGAHIFHTSDKKVWDFVNSLVEFNRYTNSPVANYKGEIYNMPFNMNTFNKMWGVITPKEAKEKIDAQIAVEKIGEPRNLEEQALSLVGRDIYTKLVKGYTEKQWGRSAKDLPSFIIKRLPVRFTYDNNYFSDKYQGIPVGGYTQLIEKLLVNADVKLSEDYFAGKDMWNAKAKKIIFTGMIDEFYGYRFGELKYRTLRFETQTLDTDNYQGNAVVNYTDYETPYTRIIEHKHFEFKTGAKTVVTKEFPSEWKKGDEPYYPVNDDENNALYEKYKNLAASEKNVIFGGRLGMYKYMDMHNIISAALDCAQSE